jgi:O-antigen/teichoic acid export membrane protein
MSAAAGTGRSALVTSAVVNWIGFAAQVIIALWLAPILVHGLGDRRYGIWSLVESVLAYLLLFDLGVAASVVRYVARFEAARDQDGLNRIFSISICIFTGAGILVLACAASAGCLLGFPADLEHEARWLLILLGLNLGVGLPLNVFPCILDGLGRFPAKTTVRTIGLFIRAALFLMVINTGGGLIELAWVITGLNVAEHLALAALVWRYLPGLRFSFALVDWTTFRIIRGYSLDAFLAMVAGRLSFQTDALVINAFLAPQFITFFALAGKLVDYAKTSIRTATTVLTPAVSSLEARGQLPAIRAVLLHSTRCVLWIILPIQAGLMILGKAFLTLWLGSPAYADRIYPTLLILALPLSLALSQSVSGRILYGIGRLRWFSRLVMAEAAINLVLSIWLVHPLGIEGVAWGTTVPHVVMNLVLAGHVCRLLGVPLGSYVRHAFVLPVAIASVLAGGWLLAAGWFDLANWFALLATGAAGLAGYVALAVVVEVGPGVLLRQVRAALSPRAAGSETRAERESGAVVPAGAQVREV